MKFPAVAFVLLAFTALAADVICKYEQPEFRTATIYARGSDQKTVLYKMHRTTFRRQNDLMVWREFNYPDGTLAARERVTYKGNQLVSCELADMQEFGKGSANVVEQNGKTKIVFDYTEGAKHRTGVENFTPEMVNNDMINPFLITHWDQLMNGETVKCRYIAVARAETVGFEFTKQRETVVNGIPMVIVKMAPSSLIIAALVDPLYFIVEKNGQHRVLQYDGPTTPKIKQGGKFKDLIAITVFDW